MTSDLLNDPVVQVAIAALLGASPFVAYGFYLKHRIAQHDRRIAELEAEAAKSGS